MIFAILISSISILLDALLSNYFPIFPFSHNIVVPMFTLVSLIIIYPYFNGDIFKYSKVCLLFGLIYDILFTNTLGLNITLFFIISYIIVFLDDNLSNSLVSIFIKMIIVIAVFDLLTYLVLMLLNYMNYEFMTLLYKFLKSLFTNSIYITILYFTTNAISKKYRIRKTN